MFSTLPDNMSSWTVVKRIPIDAVDGRMDFFIPGMGVDLNATGHLGVAFYYYPEWDCGGQPIPCQLNAGFISSIDGGLNWSNRKVVLGPISPTWLANSPDCIGQTCNPKYMIGDYISTSFGSNGKAYPAYPTATPAADGACDYGIYPNDLECDEHMVAPTNGLSL